MTRSLLPHPAAALAAACLLLLAPLTRAATEIAADNPQLQYTGRIDFSDTKAPFLSWPGTTVEANFTGDSLQIVLDDDNGKNYFDVILDGEDDYPFVLECKQGEQTYTVGYRLKPGHHTLVLYKRTEGGEGGTRFKGLVLGDGAELLPPPPRPAHKIEFYGDSITSGMGDEGADNGRDDLASEKNQRLSYAGWTARYLGAEEHCISCSGIGIMMSWFPFIMPQYYDQLSAVGNNDTSWDFSQWTPDVVVINLFQNDAWLVGRDHKLQPDPTNAQRTAAYKTFLDKLRSLYPHAYFVCALGSMDATREGSKWPGYIQSAVDQVKQEDPHARIDTLFFPFTGYGQHPRVAQQRANARMLTALIKERMGW